MDAQLPETASRAEWQSAGPVYRSIVAVDLENSTGRSNPVKGELRRAIYDLLERVMDAVPISADHLEPLTDRGDGVLLLIRPHDDVPKTVLLDRFIPLLTELLVERNAKVGNPARQIRLRAVVHAGEIHSDSRGFYGEAIDVAIRLLDSEALRSALRRLPDPLALVVSDEIHSGIVAHGYVNGDGYHPLVRVRVAGRRHYGWIQVQSGRFRMSA